MATLEYFQFPYMSDNYGVLVHSPGTGQTAAVDAGDATAYLDALETKGWELSHLLITHHHGDHTAGLAEIKNQTGCTVIGPEQLSQPISGLDKMVGDGDKFEFAGVGVEVLHTPGHTTDMMNFYFPSENIIFTGDTLFTLGCGRVFEGTKTMMWQSLQKLMQLPPATIGYSSHEYTLANAKFALSVDPDNEKLKIRTEKFEAMRADGKPTVPSTLGEELDTNPFLRAGDPAIRKFLGMEDASDSEVFAEIRSRKDNF